MRQGNRGRPPYTPEFKAEEVRLYRTSGRGLREVAHDLGIATESLRAWARQSRDAEGASRQGTLSTGEREELVRLRRENRILREEREILKIAVALSWSTTNSSRGKSSRSLIAARAAISSAAHSTAATRPRSSRIPGRNSVAIRRTE